MTREFSRKGLIFVVPMLGVIFALVTIHHAGKVRILIPARILVAEDEIAAGKRGDVVSFSGTITKFARDIPPTDWDIPLIAYTAVFKVQRCWAEGRVRWRNQGESSTGCVTWTTAAAKIGAWHLSSAVLRKAGDDSAHVYPTSDPSYSLRVWHTEEVYTVVAALDPSTRQLVPIKNIRYPNASLFVLEAGKHVPEDLLRKVTSKNMIPAAIALGVTLVAILLLPAPVRQRAAGYGLRRRFAVGCLLVGPALLCALVPKLAASSLFTALVGGSGLFVWIVIGAMSSLRGDLADQGDQA